MNVNERALYSLPARPRPSVCGKTKPGSRSHPLPLLRSAGGRWRPAPPFATSEIYLSAEASGEGRPGGRATRPPCPLDAAAAATVFDPAHFLLSAAAASFANGERRRRRGATFFFPSFFLRSFVFLSSSSCLRPFSWPIRKRDARRWPPPRSPGTLRTPILVKQSLKNWCEILNLFS